MPLRVSLALLACSSLLAACSSPPPPEGSAGSTTTTSGSSTEGSTADTGTLADSSGSSGSILDVGPGPPGCVECSIIIASQQSGEFEVSGEEIFATAQLEGHTVYAMGTFGIGRFIAAADSSLPLREQTDCPVLAWLAGTYEEPSILVFGWNHEDEWGEIPVPASVHMPPEYIGDPARLAEDYDVVIYLEESSYLDGGEQPSDEELQTALEFAAMGGGLVVSSEYAMPGGGYLTPTDLDSVNRILLPLGLESQPVSLNWGEVQGEIEFPCFPPVG